MSYTGRNPQEDLAENEDAFAVGVEASMTVMHRRVEVPGHISEVAMARPDVDRSVSLANAPKHHPPLQWDSSDETRLSSWPGSCVPEEGGLKESHIQSHVHPPNKGSPLEDPDDVDVDSVVYEQPSPFWSPFRSEGVTEGSESYDSDLHLQSDNPRVVTWPSTFRMERTNFTAGGSGPSRLSVDALLSFLRVALESVGVDVLDFRPFDCVMECSFHRGNCFISLFVRVFLPPDEASGQLLAGKSIDSGEEGDFLLEAQLREGDRLRFSGLFREILKAFKTQDGVRVGGTYRYHPRTYPAVGEGLVLEEASLMPSRQSIKLLAEQNEMINSASNPTSGVRKMLSEGVLGAGLGVEMSPPLPPDMTNVTEELDSDMAEDVITLAGMLRAPFLDVQSDSATAVAGLTADVDFLKQLSHPGAAKAASVLCTASARLLVETRHRPARRQASVIVANLATTSELRAALLSSDPAASGVGHGGSSSAANAGRSLVESLVELAMGDDRWPKESSWAVAVAEVGKKEEEIGTRRECMRALVGLSDHRKAVRDTPSMRILCSREPSGRGATDATLLTRLSLCREILERSSTSSCPRT